MANFRYVANFRFLTLMGLAVSTHCTNKLTSCISTVYVWFTLPWSVVSDDVMTWFIVADETVPKLSSMNMSADLCLSFCFNGTKLRVNARNHP